MERLICLAIGYVFGLFQTSYLYGRLKHVDIREYGSGNAGTTNAMRVLGKKAGIITYIGDCLKAILACTLIWFIFRNRGLDSDYVFLLRIYGGFGVVLGHNFPFYMGFKGGKGIAASSGVILGMGDWKITAISLFLFISVTLVSKYVSLGSLVFMGFFLVEMIVFNEMGILGFMKKRHVTGTWRIEMYVLVLVFVVLAYVKHAANIKRLLNGTERKIGQKKQAVAEQS